MVEATAIPSEAEWEYACRAGSNHKYCGGDDSRAVGWYFDNAGGRPHDVGQKRLNAFGLFDMSGNVEEWLQDCWHENYRGAPTDGSAWVAGNCEYRVVRGGDWRVGDWYLRAAARTYNLPSHQISAVLGFRLARTRQ